MYRPSTTKDSSRGKWDPVMSVGIFAGYRLRLGSHWYEEYLVWDLTGFAEFDLTDVRGSLSPQLRRPHITGRIFLYKDVLSFPLRDACEETKSTLHGVRRVAAQRGARVPETKPRDESPSVAEPLRDSGPLQPEIASDGVSAARGAGIESIKALPPDVPDSEGIRRDASGRLYKLDNLGWRYTGRYRHAYFSVR